MATIRQMFELIDGVSPKLNAISRSVDRVVGKFNRATKAATEMETAAEQGANGIQTAVERATTSTSSLGRLVDNLGIKIRNIGSGAFGWIRSGLSSIIGKFTIATIAANALMAALKYISELPERLIRASDVYAGIQARLRMVAGGIEQAAELNDLVYASAQRARGSYEEMADSVSKIAMTAKKAFPDAREVVPFMEGIQKLFVIGGTAVEQQKNAMLQLTQALGSGRLQGDEFRSIAEAAPLIEKMVADYMQIDAGQLKKISSEGKITADILKNAILTNLDRINEQFKNMPRTWEQNMQIIKNTAQRVFAPVFVEITALANSDAGQVFANTMVWGLHVAADAALGVINNIKWLAGVAQRTGSYIGSWLSAGFTVAYQYLDTFVAFAIAGLAIYAGYWIASNAALVTHISTLIVAAATQAVMNTLGAAYAAIMALIHIRTTLATAATAAWTLVTNGLSAAWRILNVTMYLNPIGLIIGLVLVVIGVFAAWVVHTYGLRNALASAFSTMAGIVANAVNFMIDRINNLIQLINKAAEGINGLFGTDIGMVGEISYRADPEQWSKDAGDFVQNFDIHNYIPGLSPENMPDASYNATGTAFEDLGQSGKKTARNTDAIKDAMEISEEDLKYLREAAEQEAINRYTTATVQIDMGGISNNISNDMDVDGMMTYMNDSLLQAMAAGAEGVHPT